MQNLSIHPLSSTKFQIMPVWTHPNDFPLRPCDEVSDTLNASPCTHKYKTVMKDENGKSGSCW